MKKYLGLFALALVMSGCSSVLPEPGQEAVIVRHPRIWGQGGVDPTPVSGNNQGRKYVAWTTEAKYVWMVPLRIDLVFDDLMTSDGVPIDFHAVLSYRITDSVRLARDFGADFSEAPASGGPPPLPGFFARNLEQPFRTAVHDEVKKHGMNDMAILATASEAVDEAVSAHLVRIIAELKVPIVLLDLSLGRANPPDAIKTQRVETATQEQRINTEKQRKLAEDQRKMAEEARATADSAYNLKMNATDGRNMQTAEFLQYLDIQMKQQACARGGCTFIVGNATPLVQVGK